MYLDNAIRRLEKLGHVVTLSVSHEDYGDTCQSGYSNQTATACWNSRTLTMHIHDGVIHTIHVKRSNQVACSTLGDYPGTYYASLKQAIEHGMDADSCL